MDLFSLLRTLGALGVVLGLLAGALWLVRRYDIKLPGRVTGQRKRIELVERVSVDAKRSIALIRRDGCEHLILIGPDGDLVIETGIAPPDPPAHMPPPSPRIQDAFSRLVDRVPDVVVPIRPPEPRKQIHRPRWNRAAVRSALHG